MKHLAKFHGVRDDLVPYYNGICGANANNRADYTSVEDEVSCVGCVHGLLKKEKIFRDNRLEDIAELSDRISSSQREIVNLENSVGDSERKIKDLTEKKDRLLNGSVPPS